MPKQRSHLSQLTLFWLVIGAILITGDMRHWWDGPREFVENIMLIMRADTRVSLNQKIHELEATVISLKQEKESLTAETRDLRSQLEAPLPATFSFVPATVIRVFRESEDAQMLLALPENHAIQPGQPVVVESILIGVVVSTTPRMGIVRLVSSPQSKITAISGAGSNGIVTGGESTSFDTATFDRILQSASLISDSIVTTSGEDTLPNGLAIGTIEEIISEAREPFRRASLKLSLDPSKIQRVFVVQW